MAGAYVHMLQLLEEHKMESAQTSIVIDGFTYTCLENLLEIPFKYFIELVNQRIEEDDFTNWNSIAACLYRRDWTQPFDPSEWISNAKLFWTSSCKIGFWGIEKFNELISLLKQTYPILYENGKEDEEQEEGRRAYNMLNAVAKDDPTKWAEAETLPLWRVFAWLELKEIQHQNEKQRKRSS